MASTSLPMEPDEVTSCDVLVIGAGPAGSAAAKVMATSGLDVLLVDQYPLGRDKTCGDALLPDALEALQRLGLFDKVMSRARDVKMVRCVGPSDGRIDVPCQLVVLQRRVFDRILAEAALEAGARWLAPVRFQRTIQDHTGRTVGAILKRGDGQIRVRAKWVFLATGAMPKPLVSAGVCKRVSPSGVAIRAYVRAPELTIAPNVIHVVWNSAVRPGYGWIFPTSPGVFNIGVGITGHDLHFHGARRSKSSLRQHFEAFCSTYAPAAELMRAGQIVGPLKGAPLRCTLEGARWTVPGLMTIGEAVGSTYAFTGEGIGKAMQTAMFAADALLMGYRNSASDDSVRSCYEARLRDLKPRFRFYARANGVNSAPWLADLVIWRAKKSRRLLERMSGVLDETSNPGYLLTLRGLVRLFLE